MSTWRSQGVDPGAVEALSSGLAASELWSLLLEVLERRAGARAPAELLAQFERDGFTRPAPVDQRTLLELDSELLAAAAAFEAIQLSPVAPLGSCSAVGLASQNKVLSALRGTEVVSDPTNVLALECARRLRRDPGTPVRLATCMRVLRAQQVPEIRGFAQHFRLFAMASAGREEKDHAFVTGAIVEHIRTMLAALERLEARGYAFPERAVRVLATPARASLGDRIAAAISGVPVTREPLEHGYYHGLRFMIGSSAPEVGSVPFIDGGAFDWVAKLASNRRLVFVATGLGSQILPQLFRQP